jgi:prolyl-tRNA synthetase
VYSLLPLGLRVLNKINNIIREEMNSIGGQELIMSALQNPEIWKISDRWDQDVWFKTALNVGGEAGFGWTQEEAITRIATHFVNSYKDLPFYAYQIQTKFRNEERAKSGILRGREFLMKDLYSFHSSQKDLDEFYEKAKSAYTKIFERVGLGEHTFETFASGGAFSKYSHEFQTISDAGEDSIHLSSKKKIAINNEVMNDEMLRDLKISSEELETKSAIEVGNIFKLGTRFSEALKLYYKDENGKEHPVIMGSYGIGPTRLIGTIVEVLSDDKGIVWPDEVAPFRVHLVSLAGSEEVEIEADRIYETLNEHEIEVLYDDRNLRAGEKFADSELIGIPNRIVISEKTISEGGVEEITRNGKGTHIIPESQLLDRLTK